MSKLTYENLNQSKTEINSLVESQKKIVPTLLNKKYWLTKEFQEDFVKRNRTFSSDEEVLKKDFIKWHKIECERLFDPNTSKLKHAYIKRVMDYLAVHPLMTTYDYKRIQLIKEDIKSKFIRTIYFNSFVVFPIGVLIIYRKAGIRSRHNLNKAIIFRTLSFLAFLLIFQDIFYKKIFYFQSLNRRFNQEKIFKKYFSDYLKNDDNL